jgi:hypothetical protein
MTHEELIERLAAVAQSFGAIVEEMRAITSALASDPTVTIIPDLPAPTGLYL